MNVSVKIQHSYRTDSVPLKAFDQSPVRSQAHLFHGILEGDEVFDVEVWCIGKVLGGRVKVDIEARSFIETKVLYQGGAKGGLLVLSTWLYRV